MAHTKKAHDRSQAREPVRPSKASSASAESSSSSGLRAFYVELSSNLDKLSDFIADPAAVARRAGLSKEETELLFSGDQGRIYASLRPELMVPPPPAPQPAAGQPGAATQAAPAPAAQGSPGASPWPNPYPYGYAWPSYSTGFSGYQDPYGQNAFFCPAPQSQQ